MTRRTDKEAARWLLHARDEFQDAEELRQRRRYYLALFHFQQAAEKALKAYLFRRTAAGELLFTHSIAELLGLALEADPDFKTVSRSARLDEYYIPTRYPNGLPGEVPSRFYQDPEQAAEAMRLAKGVIDLVEAKIAKLTW